MEMIEKKSTTFVSSLTFTPQKVQEILFQKIQEENEYIQINITNEDRIKEKEKLKSLDYESGKIDIVSLFSGAGGLDLGIELSDLVVQYGEKSL